MIYRAPQPRIRLSNNCQRRQRSAFNESGCTEQKFDELSGTFGVVAFRLSLGEGTFVAGGGVRLAVFTAFRTGEGATGVQSMHWQAAAATTATAAALPSQRTDRHGNLAPRDMAQRSGSVFAWSWLCRISDCILSTTSHIPSGSHMASQTIRVKQDKIRLFNLFKSARRPWQ